MIRASALFVHFWRFTCINQYKIYRPKITTTGIKSFILLVSAQTKDLDSLVTRVIAYPCQLLICTYSWAEQGKVWQVELCYFAAKQLLSFCFGSRPTI